MAKENGNLVIIKGKELRKERKEDKEIYTSKVLSINEATKIIISWNVITPKESHIEVEGRFFIRNKDKNKSWTSWLSWGQWGVDIERKSLSTDSKDAKVDVDTCIIKNEAVAIKFQIRVKSYYKEKDSRPQINIMALSYINGKEKIHNSKLIKINNNKLNETPCLSQMIREKNIANRICSPTSITMVLNRYDEELVVEDVAWKCFDYNYNEFGNWTFNIAFAGSMSYNSYVRFGNFDILLKEIYNGYPIIASVKYTNDVNNKDYPYIENSPVTTAGHLLVVCGVEDDGENKWVIVNDPANKDNESVRVRYKAEEFINAWEKSNCVMYCIHDKVR